MKKLISALLVVVMIFALSVSAFADTYIGDDGGSGQVELFGEVSEGGRIVSVTLPTTVKFAISINNETDRHFVMLSSGTGVVTNLGNSAVFLTLTKVEEADGDTGLLAIDDLELFLNDISLNTSPFAETGLGAILNTDGTLNLRVSGAVAEDAVGPVAIPKPSYSIMTTLKVYATNPGL